MKIKNAIKTTLVSILASVAIGASFLGSSCEQYAKQYPAYQEGIRKPVNTAPAYPVGAVPGASIGPRHNVANAGEATHIYYWSSYLQDSVKTPCLGFDAGDGLGLTASVARTYMRAVLWPNGFKTTSIFGFNDIVQDGVRYILTHRNKTGYNVVKGKDTIYAGFSYFFPQEIFAEGKRIYVIRK